MRTDMSLILMDTKLPKMSGYDATQKIKKINNEIPIIAVSAYSEAEEIRRAMIAGCNDYLVKPIQKDQLFEKLKKQLDYDFQITF